MTSPDATRTCANCGASLEGRSPQAIYCTRRCKKNASRRRRFKTDAAYRQRQRERGRPRRNERRRERYATDPEYRQKSLDTRAAFEARRQPKCCPSCGDSFGKYSKFDHCPNCRKGFGPHRSEFLPMLKCEHCHTLVIKGLKTKYCSRACGAKANNNYTSLDSIRRRNARRRQRLHEGADLTPTQWEQILDAHHGLCAYCSNPAGTLDHIMPIALDGQHTASNVVPACAACNRSKGAMHPRDWQQLLARSTLPVWMRTEPNFECELFECDQPRVALGLCSRHYNQHRRNAA